MIIISKNIRYVYHDLNTRFHACKTYSNKTFSVKDLSKRPHTPHPNAHTSDEIKHIEELLRRNPYIGLSELYVSLNEIIHILDILLHYFAFSERKESM